MNFGVIGEPCIDYIHRDGEKMQEKLGGILYAVTGLSLIARDEHAVYPVMNLGSDRYDYIISFLSGLKNIRFDFIKKVTGKVRVVQLFYKNREESYICPGDSHGNPVSKKTYDREESSTEPIEPIEYELLSGNINKLDGLLINMVSGVDITLDTLKKIRKYFRGYIHLDIHNVVMKTAADGKRCQGPVNDWFEWLTCCDTLQMNETEASVISPEKLREYDIAYKVLSAEISGTKAMVITRGHEGVSLFTKKKNINNKEVYFDIDRLDEPAIENNHFKDSTGCGDILGAGFFYRNALTSCKEFPAALMFANKLSGKKTQYTGVEEMAEKGFN